MSGNCHAPRPEFPADVTDHPENVTLSMSDALAAAGDWTPDLVKAELAEAIKVVMRTVGRVGPRGYGSGMPTFLVDLDRELGGWKPVEDPRRPPPAAVISRADAVIRWPIEYLGAWDGPRVVLRIWLAAKATRRPWSRLLKAKGIPKTTAERARDKAFAVIAAGLNRDGVKP